MVKGHYNRHDRPKKQLTKDFGEDITQKTGYVPTHIKVQQMAQSGLRLNPTARSQYDYYNSAGEPFPKEAMDPVISVARRRGVDIVDVRKEAKELQERQIERQKQVDEENKKSAQQAQKDKPDPRLEPDPEKPSTDKETSKK